MFKKTGQKVGEVLGYVSIVAGIIMVVLLVQSIFSGT